MLRTLRWKLTLAFMFIIFLFVVVVGAGGYIVLRRDFDQNTDLSLQHRMAIQFQFYGFALPAELHRAEEVWDQQQADQLSVQTGNQIPISGESEDHEGNEDHEEEDDKGHETESGEGHEAEELIEGAYSSDLALIFIFPLDASGQLLTDPNPFDPPMEPDNEASAAAIKNGSDWRTLTLDSGERVRLLSYHLPTPNGLTVLQMGRSLADQDRQLNQLILGVSALGVLLMLVAGLSSWWLAGRSLGPAQRAWDQQQAFVANASHELRTPLTLIRASTEVALRGKVGKKESTLLQDVIRETDYMGRLVDDLLLLSRLDSGRLHLERESIEIPELIDEIQQQTTKMATDHEFIPATHVPAIKIEADPIRLRQVLLILLDNAIKHTPAGSKVWIETEADDENLSIRVRDNGPGIAREHLPHIFDRFYQASSSQENQNRSNGLGLSIAKGLTVLHGGTIQIQSGPGTTFEMSIPRK